MTNAFIAFERHRKDGAVYLDQDGACYLQPHTHPLLKDKVFCNQAEVIQSIRDYNSPKADPMNPAVMVIPENPFKGEFILLNVISF